MANTDNFVPLKETELQKNNNKKPVIEYNNKTALSYRKHGFESPVALDYQERTFISRIDPDGKYPVERMVTKMVRLRAIDHSTKKKELKEYLVYYENWYGKDWLGRSVAPVADHVEGVYQEQIAEPVYDKMNRNIIGHQRTGEYTVHYIPFSKEKVDEIIKNSSGTYAETINFTVKNGPLRNDQFSYNQFVNLSFEDCVELILAKGGPAFAQMKKQKEEK